MIIDIHIRAFSKDETVPAAEAAADEVEEEAEAVGKATSRSSCGRKSQRHSR
jgi:hypothetical protein